MIFFKVRVIFKSKTQQNLHEMKLSITVKSQILNYFTFFGGGGEHKTTQQSYLSSLKYLMQSALDYTQVYYLY